MKGRASAKWEIGERKSESAEENQDVLCKSFSSHPVDIVYVRRRCIPRLGVLNLEE